MENFEDKFKEAELRKLQSEISRNKAEQKKFLTEAKEIDKKLSKGRFHIDTIIKSIVGGIVVAGLLAAWFIAYMQPLLQKNQELSAIENKILAEENNEQKLINTQDSIALSVLRISTKKDILMIQTQNDSLKIQLSQSETITEGLKSKLDGIAKAYQHLSNENKYTASEKIKYAALAEQANVEANHLKIELQKINQSQVKSDKLSIDIFDKLLSTWLISNSWRVNIMEGDQARVELWKFESNRKLTIEKDYKNNFVANNLTWEVNRGVINIGEDFVIYTATVTSDAGPILFKGDLFRNAAHAVRGYWSARKIDDTKY